MYKFLLLIILIAPVFSKAQPSPSVTISGMVTDTKKMPLPYANIIFKTAKEGVFVTGTISGQDGRFTAAIKSGSYLLEISMMGFVTKNRRLLLVS